MAYESYIINGEAIISTTLTDHAFDIGGNLKRPANKVLVRNNEGYSSLSGDTILVRFNKDENQKLYLNPGETLSVEFQVWHIECAAVGTSGANSSSILIIAS